MKSVRAGAWHEVSRWFGSCLHYECVACCRQSSSKLVKIAAMVNVLMHGAESCVWGATPFVANQKSWVKVVTLYGTPLWTESIV